MGQPPEALPQALPPAQPEPSREHSGQLSLHRPPLSHLSAIDEKCGRGHYCSLTQGKTQTQGHLGQAVGKGNGLVGKDDTVR